MRKFILLAAITALFTLGYTTCNAQDIVASSNYITKDVKVGSFSSISVYGTPDVYYTQTSGGAPQIEIYGSDNVVPHIEVFVEDNTLIVKYKKNVNITGRRKLEVRVSAPAPESMELKGSGDIYIPKGINTSSLQLFVRGSGDIMGKKITCNELNVSVVGSGDIELKEVAASTINAKVSGSGDVELEGTGVDVNYSVAGSGDIRAAKLKADNVQADVAGSGDITCHAVKTLKGGVRGSGDVAYKGNPEISFSKKGLSKL